MGVLVRFGGMPRMRVVVFAVPACMFVLVAGLVRMLVAVSHIAVLVFMRVRMCANCPQCYFATGGI